MKIKLLTLGILLILLFAGAASAGGVNPPKESVTAFVEGYDLKGQNNSFELACEIGQAAEDQGWNCDVRTLTFSNHSDVFVDVFYPEADTAKGYLAYYAWLGPQKKEVSDFTSGTMFYKNWGSVGKADCKIKGVESYYTVESYYGGNSTEPNDPVIEDNTTPEDTSNESNVCEVPDNTSNETQAILNNTTEPSKKPSKISMYIENGTSGDCVNIDANLNQQPSRGTLEKIKESLGSWIDAIFGGY